MKHCKIKVTLYLTNMLITHRYKSFNRRKGPMHKYRIKFCQFCDIAIQLRVTTFVTTDLPHREFTEFGARPSPIAR